MQQSVRQNPEYLATRLLSRPDDARTLGIAHVLLKNEADRFAEQGLGCFKILGVLSALAGLKARGLPKKLVCASDGNFGRAVAWAAAQEGVEAQVFMPRTVSPARFGAIESLGAIATPIDGNYDDAIAEASRAAQADGVIEFSDTGHAAAEIIPRQVQYGYGVAAAECIAQWPEMAAFPTHLFVPAGVGGFAAGLIAGLETGLGADLPRVVTVEPLDSDCVRLSIEKGGIRTVFPSPTRAETPTMMQGLACQTPSTTAWPILQKRVFAAISISDPLVLRAMRDLSGDTSQTPVVSGESGASAYAALLAVADNNDLRTRLGITAESVILVTITEAATDPEIYARIVNGT